jgi:hypothetical protein
MSDYIRKGLRIVRVGGLLLLLGSCSTGPESVLTELFRRNPDPSLTPQQVVAIQLEAFRNNDEEDRGIEVAFRFASPENRAITGPVPRFAGMMRGGAYRIMLEYDSVLYAPLVRDGDVAVQRVALTMGGVTIVYDFVLRRQSAGVYVDCWMTEGVQVIQLPRERETPRLEMQEPLSV